MNTDTRRQAIDDFEARYSYDSQFMRDMLAHAPTAYDKFEAFMPFANHRDILERDTYWVARLAAMQGEDCGDCLQLNVRLALEAGVARGHIEKAIRAPSQLPRELADVHAYSHAVATGATPDSELAARVLSALSPGALIELGVCIATARVFPAIKRTLGLTRSCTRVTLEV